MTIERRWFSVNETAKALGLHPQSVYSMIADGRIPAAKIGRLIRCDFRALEADLTAQAEGRPPAGRSKGRTR
jgi:excisionase family DNA binding protein